MYWKAYIVNLNGKKRGDECSWQRGKYAETWGVVIADCFYVNESCWIIVLPVSASSVLYRMYNRAIGIKAVGC